MDESSQYFSSPPSSLPDSLTSAQGTIPPIPRPRRSSSTSSSSLSSTPKQQIINFHGSLTTRPGQNNTSGSNTRTPNKCTKVSRTPSVESSDLRIKPIANLGENSDVDSEDDDNNYQQANSNEKLSSNCRGKRSHPKFASRSLPVTPRINGNCSTTQSLMNGGMSSFISGSVGSSTPLLVAPHMMSHFPLDGSLNSIGSLSPVASQYVTCSSGIMSEAPDKTLPGSIDYSSLPLPKEDSFRIPQKRNISRHMSEPCIHETPFSHLSGIGKCSSCPNKKVSSKHKKKDCNHNGSDNEPFSGLEYQLRNSICGIDSKSDNLETVELQWKFIKTLLEELSKCRSQNNKMVVELHQAQMEIQMLKAALDSYIDAGIQPGLITEMVSQIHAAQKVRDEAMMSRIKLANEERDAAITQTQSLLEKLGYSPKSSFDYMKCNVYCCNDQASQPPASNCNRESRNLAAIEEELKALRLALNVEEQEKSHIDSRSNRGVKESEVETQEVLEELKTKLKESEISKLKLQEKCSSLEHIFDHLHRKINGLNSVDTSTINPTSLSFLDMALLGSKPKHEEEIETSPRLSSCEEHSPNNRCKKHTSCDRNRKIPDGDTETEGESLSSADSTEASSVASWKHSCGDSHHQHHTFSSESGSYSSSHQSSTPQTSLSHDGINNNFNNMNNITKNSASVNDNRSSNSLTRNEFKPRNLGSVTLMGPITEL